MIAANFTLGEVIWLLFELVLIVLRSRTDKTAVTYIEVALYINIHFKCRFLKAFFYIRKPAGSPPHLTVYFYAVGMSPNNEYAIGYFTRKGLRDRM